ncbi:flavin reductase family protein [Consotaella aegiceratis]|uniref:flavin reductase family protein n=1 Tax=Consotaella aegiceratis TaxID=3097961 RepID=UPI002F408A5E
MPDTLDLQPSLRPFVESRSFRDAMASMGSTACLVTTRLGAERLGRTVTSVFSLSVEPPAILISIDRTSRLADHIAKAQGFSFAMLAEDQQAVADAFAGRGDPERRFDTGRWLSWVSGHPRLQGAVAAMDCTVLGTIETATHILCAGGVVDIELTPDRTPLVWQQRRYRALVDRQPS